MAKTSFQPYRFTVLLLNSDEGVVTGLASPHDLAKTKRLALSALRLDGRAALAAIHNFAAHAAELENREPVMRVSLDDEVDDGEA